MTCPRCSGPLRFLEDQDGSWLSCWFCGHHIDLLQPPPETKVARIILPSDTEKYRDNASSSLRSG